MSLHTIGYEGTTIARLIDTVGGAGVGLVIDVRALPLSRKPGFSKRQLAASLDQSGIGYLHLRALGTPKSGRIAARAGRTAEMRAIFADQLRTPEAIAALAEATSLATRRPVCLLCYEADHRTCHRAMVADLICERTGLPAEHLVA